MATLRLHFSETNILWVQEVDLDVLREMVNAIIAIWENPAGPGTIKLVLTGRTLAINARQIIHFEIPEEIR